MSEGLAGLSEQLASVANAGAASVVRVEGRRRGASSGVVWSADGFFVGAHHSIDLDEGIPIGLSDDRTLSARVVARDPGTDLAVLRADATGLTPPRWAQEPPRPGHLVLGLSRPGRASRVRLGVVSAAASEWRTPGGSRLESYLETDIGPHPGFSGGLLLGTDGRALGLTTAGLLRGVGMAIAGGSLGRLVEALLTRGGPRRGWLGIGTQPVALGAGLTQRLGQPSALLVLSVHPDSPAARAGLMLGDVMVRSGEHRLESPAALLPLLDEDRIGTGLELHLLRAGEEHDATVVVGERAA